MKDRNGVEITLGCRIRWSDTRSGKKAGVRTGKVYGLVSQLRDKWDRGLHKNVEVARHSIKVQPDAERYGWNTRVAITRTDLAEVIA